MEELEHIEAQRIAVCAVVGAAFELALTIWGLDDLSTHLAAFTAGLLASGIYVAKRKTLAHNWAYLEAEARQLGYTVSRRGIWLGNLMPAVVMGLASAWWVNTMD